jgi:hypothetical protein
MVFEREKFSFNCKVPPSGKVFPKQADRKMGNINSKITEEGPI